MARDFQYGGRANTHCHNNNNDNHEEQSFEMKQPNITENKSEVFINSDRLIQEPGEKARSTGSHRVGMRKRSRVWSYMTRDQKSTDACWSCTGSARDVIDRRSVHITTFVRWEGGACWGWRDRSKEEKEGCVSGGRRPRVERRAGERESGLESSGMKEGRNN